MDIAIPATTENKKLPFICFHNSCHLKVNRSRKACKLMERMELINSSYIPVIKAMVPPDTPGMTSAAPIAHPRKTSNR